MSWQRDERDTLGALIDEMESVDTAFDDDEFGVRRRQENVERLQDAARAYVAARLANDAAEPKDWTARAAEVDRTWHALLEVSGLSETREETEG